MKLSSEGLEVGSEHLLPIDLVFQYRVEVTDQPSPGREPLTSSEWLLAFVSRIKGLGV